MRIAIVSDIHGNLSAFQAVVADLRETAPDLVLHGGDLAEGGARPAEIVDAIRSFGWQGVVGNTDEVLWAPGRLEEFAARAPKLRPLMACIGEIVAATCEWLGADRIAWLQRLPQIQRAGSLALVHASPDDLWRGPLSTATDGELEATYGALGTPIAVYGHIHAPFVRRVGAFTVANSGSAGLPYDGDPRASYLLLDDSQITIQRVEYDVEAECRTVLQSGLPHSAWVAHMLRTAQYQPPLHP